MAEKPDFDIAIAGAGPTGLALAALLAGQGLSIAVIDRQSANALENPEYDGREVALTHASWKVLQRTGAIDHIGSDEVSLIRDARVMNGKSPYSLNFSAKEVHEDHLGYMIANNVIRRGLYKAIHQKRIAVVSGMDITGIHMDHSCARLAFGQEMTLSARLVAAADSRFSKLRDMMGIAASRHDFKRVCIVCRMSHEKDLWRTAYECFGLERTLAVLPLRNQECSVVLTLPQEQADRMMAMTPEEFARNLAPDLQPYCGRLKLVSRLYTYPLIGIYAHHFKADRFALIGDAAVGMHPVTAHGFNLGLGGAATLAEQIGHWRRCGFDIDDPRILEKYEQLHRKRSMPLYHGTNALVQLYTRTGPVSKLARQALLHIGNHFTPARKIILRHLTDQR